MIPKQNDTKDNSRGEEPAVIVTKNETEIADTGFSPTANVTHRSGNHEDSGLL